MREPDFVSFESIVGDPSRGMLLMADHARNTVPAKYKNLGLPSEQFERHIGYDIGVERVTRGLAAQLGVPAVMSTYSRLLIDPNRGEDDPTLVMRLSDGAVIPGNHPLSSAEIEERIHRYHRPYHDEIDRQLTEIQSFAGKAPLVFSIHSFTDKWKGIPRPWHIGILWDRDDRAVTPFLDALRRQDHLVVGDNEPYDGALGGDSMYRHCTSNGFAHALIELRQDLIGTEAGANEWVELLAPILDELNNRDDVHIADYKGSRADRPNH